MDKIWHKYLEEKPTVRGYYAVIMSWGATETREWNGTDFDPNDYDAIKAWAFLSDITPSWCKDDELKYFYDRRGRKPDECLGNCNCCRNELCEKYSRYNMQYALPEKFL